MDEADVDVNRRRRWIVRADASICGPTSLSLDAPDNRMLDGCCVKSKFPFDVLDASENFDSLKAIDSVLLFVRDEDIRSTAMRVTVPATIRHHDTQLVCIVLQTSDASSCFENVISRLRTDEFAYATAGLVGVRNIGENVVCAYENVYTAREALPALVDVAGSVGWHMEEEASYTPGRLFVKNGMSRRVFDYRVVYGNPEVVQYALPSVRVDMNLRHDGCRKNNIIIG